MPSNRRYSRTLDPTVRRPRLTSGLGEFEWSGLARAWPDAIALLATGATHRGNTRRAEASRSARRRSRGYVVWMLAAFQFCAEQAPPMRRIISSVPSISARRTELPTRSKSPIADSTHSSYGWSATMTQLSRRSLPLGQPCLDTRRCLDESMAYAKTTNRVRAHRTSVRNHWHLQCFPSGTSWRRQRRQPLLYGDGRPLWLHRVHVKWMFLHPCHHDHVSAGLRPGLTV